MKKTIIALTLAAAIGSQAAVIYSTSFTTAEDAAWSDTTAWTGTIPGNDYTPVDGRLKDSSTWASQPAFGMTNTATTGEALVYRNWQKALMAPSQAFNVGDTISITATMAYNAAGGNNRELLDIGIAPGANTTIGAGMQFQIDSGIRWEIENEVGSIATGATTYQTDVVATENVFETLVVSITKSTTANEFDVTGSVAGDTGAGYSFTYTDAALYALSEVKVGVIGQAHVTGVSGIQLGSFEYEVIPEPATLSLVGAFGASILFIRRRFMM